MTEPSIRGSLDNSCLVITGAPAAGKSTVGQLVAERLTRSARLNGDFVHELIVSGFVSGPDQPLEQVQLTQMNLGALAVNFAGAGFTPIVDTLIADRAGLDYLVDHLAPLRVLLVVLVPSINVHHHRNSIRDEEEQFFFDGYDRLLDTMRRDYGGVGWWFDTSALTPEQTTERILADAADLAVI